VVGVEASQKELVRLSTALVLSDDQAGDDAENVLGRGVRAEPEVTVADRLGRGGRRRCGRLDGRLVAGRAPMLVEYR
jgi:hypothetical protein